MRKLLVILFALFATTCQAYHISNAGKEFIKKHESCRLTSYWDTNGYTIGYGHHAKDVYEGMKITQAEADRLFDEDIKRIEKSVDRLLKALPYEYNFSQSFIDGFVSFVFNVGESGARKSTFYERLMRCRVHNGKMDEGDFNYAVAGIKTSRISCEAHKRRRYAEHKLMLG